MKSERYHDEQGASAVEYGLLISGIAAVVFLAIMLFGGSVRGVFTDSCSTIEAERVAQGQPASACG